MKRPSSGLPSSRLLISTTCVVLAGVGLLAYWIHERSPETRVAQARVIAQTDKSRALTIVRAAIADRNGDFPAAQLFECQILLDLRRTNDAENAFRSIQRADAIDPVALCKLAERAHGLGLEMLAKRAYLAAGEFVRGDRLQLKRLIYSVYIAREPDFEKSVIELCDDYSRRNPRDAYGCLMSARLYSERHLLSDAVKSLKEALKRDVPAQEVGLHRLGLARMSLTVGDVETAREQCDLLAKLTMDEQSQQSLPAILAEVLLREGKPDEAFAMLEALPANQSTSAEIHALKGKSKYNLRLYSDAISDLIEAVRMNDFDLESHYLLGQCYLKTKNEAMANRHLDRSRELNAVKAQILTLENQLREDLHNKSLKIQLAELNEKRGDLKRAAAWRRAAQEGSTP